jgi:DnaJ homologue, subfamily C, member 28, conserved domain
MTDSERPDRTSARDRRTGRSAAAARIEQQASWVDLQVRQAEARGEFDDLPGYGKPIEGLGTQHDPDWWLKKLVEREQITGVLPPALQLRKDDTELDARLDRLSRETDVRREVEEFNERVRAAFYQPLGGPPMITKERDVEAEVEHWEERRAHVAAEAPEDPAPPTPRRRWWRRG